MKIKIKIKIKTKLIFNWMVKLKKIILVKGQKTIKKNKNQNLHKK